MGSGGGGIPDAIQLLVSASLRAARSSAAVVPTGSPARLGATLMRRPQAVKPSLWWRTRERSSHCPPVHRGRPAPRPRASPRVAGCAGIGVESGI